MFQRILVANRGEIALRIVRACRALGIESVAVHSEADAQSPHLEQADRRICIGGPRSAESYLDMDAVLQAAEQTGCQAVHPGYGFLSENALFAERCRQHRLTFIGPRPGVMRLLGDKASARRTLEAAGVPVVPGTGVLSGPAEGLAAARRLGFPVVLKATAGGGGRGMRVCRDEAAFARAFEEASLEARLASGNGGLYLERYLEGGRHLELQILADAHGGAVHLGERECSVQRHHQKLVEESPSPVVEEPLRAELGARGAAAAARIGYTGAGTLEFLRDAGGRLYFVEANTRLQVEHPVTEAVTGLDLVQEQIRVAANERLSVRQADVRFRGHAFECRVNAEDPFDGWRPSPGLVERFEPPPPADDGVRVRLDTHVRAGYRIPPWYDSLLAKLVVHGPDRESARRGMLRALERFRIEGVRTTLPALRRVFQDEGFARGDYDTGLVKRLLG